MNRLLQNCFYPGKEAIAAKIREFDEACTKYNACSVEQGSTEQKKVQVINEFIEAHGGTQICKRDAAWILGATVTSLIGSCFYYYYVCSGNDWGHFAKMVIPPIIMSMMVLLTTLIAVPWAKRKAENQHID